MLRWSLATVLLGLLPTVVTGQTPDSTGGPTVYEQAALDEPPIISDANGCIAALHESTPARDAFQSRNGHAIFSFIVAADGSVEPASITVLSTTDRRFIAAGRQTLLDARCRFQPGRKQGQPVRARIKQKLSWSVRFTR